jgi:hypothetical protein
MLDGGSFYIGVVRLRKPVREAEAHRATGKRELPLLVLKVPERV